MDDRDPGGHPVDLPALPSLSPPWGSVIPLSPPLSPAQSGAGQGGQNPLCPRCWLGHWQALEDLEVEVPSWHTGGKVASSPGVAQLACLHVLCPDSSPRPKSRNQSSDGI